VTDTSFDREQFFERELSPLEVEQRKILTLDLLTERDDLITAVDEKRREIRALNKSRRNLESRTAQIRREIRSGKVLEPRQVSLDLPPADGTRNICDRFEELYPLATTVFELSDVLAEVLTDAQWTALLDPEETPRIPWGSGTGIFDAVATWARIESAHRDSELRARDGRAAIADLTIPARTPMPEALQQLLSGPQKKKPSKKKRKAARK
jgi:hypothetical protein